MFVGRDKAMPCLYGVPNFTDHSTQPLTISLGLPKPLYTSETIQTQ